MIEDIRDLYNFKNEEISKFNTVVNDLIQYIDNNDECIDELSQFNRTIINFVISNTNRKYLILLLDNFVIRDKHYNMMTKIDKVNFVKMYNNLVKTLLNQSIYHCEPINIDYFIELNDLLVLYFENKLNDIIIGDYNDINKLNIDFCMYFNMKDYNAFDQYQLGINLLKKMQTHDKKFYFLKDIELKLIMYHNLSLLNETLKYNYPVKDLILNDDQINHKHSNYKMIIVGSISLLCLTGTILKCI